MLKKEIKAEIVKLFKTEEILDYGIVADKLQLSLPLVVNLCNKLGAGGEIGEPI